jgi:hypothetical protein
MMHFAEKCRQICSNGIYELGHLRRIAGFQKTAIIPETVDPKIPQTPGQPAVNQFALCFADRYPGMQGAESADSVKVVIREFKFAKGFHTSFP